MSDKITMNNGLHSGSNDPFIPFIFAYGACPNIWNAAQHILDSIVKKAYNGEQHIDWKDVLAGKKVFTQTGSWLPYETVDTLKEYLVGIKGPHRHQWMEEFVF